MVADLFALTGIPMVGSVDEILGIAAWGGVIYYVIFQKKFSKETLQLLTVLIIFLCIGFLGNVFSGVTYSLKLILMDGFMFSKPYVIFIFMTLFMTDRLAASILRFVYLLSKGMLWILTFLAVLSQFVYTSMTLYSGSFRFFAEYSGTVSWWGILFLAVIWANSEKDSGVFGYFLLCGILIFINGSGLGLISYGLGIALYLVIRKKKKIKWYYIAACCGLCIFLGRNELNEYLFIESAPRALLLKYAFVTANHYLPLGAGFATYGSSSAIRDYSALYRLYGFNKVPGMTEGYHPYLMDNYYQQVIGQLGYPGIILLACFMIQIIKRILIIESADVRNAALLLYGCLVFAGIGFGTASSWGCSVYMLLPLFFACSGVTNKRDITGKQSPLRR